MKQIRFTLGVLSMLLLVSCGGGNGAAPVPETGDGALDTAGFAPIETPQAVVGSHEVSVVPGMAKVLTGAAGAELAAIVGKYGCDVAYQNGDWATLHLPAGLEVDAAVALLEKEYNIIQAEPLYQVNTARISYGGDALRAASFVPLDPFAGEQFVGDLRYDPGIF